MERKTVSSSMIESIGYSKEKELLEVEFNNNFVFQYEDVPQEVYDDLIGAESIGKTFNKLVRGKYGFERVD